MVADSIRRRALFVGASVCVMGAPAPVDAQVSDSVIRARAEQMSICPVLYRRDDGPLEGKSLTITPFFVFAGQTQLGIGLNVGSPLNGAMGSLAVLEAIAMTEGNPRYARAHNMTIQADDSITLTPKPTYSDASTRPEFHFETVAAQIPVFDLVRLANANKIVFKLGGETFRFNTGQVQAVRALLREVQHPTSDAMLRTGCVGPNADGWMDSEPRPMPQRDSSQSRSHSITYFAFQVEKPASSIGFVSLPYPTVLKAAGVEGTVLAQFVVLDDGAPDMDTFHILKSSHELFSAAVRAVVPQMRFNPAEIGGKKVRQIVQLPFEFKLGERGRTQSDTAAQGPVLLRRGGSSEIISVPRNLPKWTMIAISPSDSAHLPADVFLSSQVDVPVRSPNGAAIQGELPPELAAIFTGYAVLEFIVNTDGSVDASTFKVLRATSREIAAVYSTGAHGMLLLPAELHGKKVRQLVVMATPVLIKPRQ